MSDVREGRLPSDSIEGRSERGTSRRELLRRGLYLAGGAALGPALLSACAPGTSGPVAATATGGGRKRGGTLTLAHIGEPSTFDPYSYFFGEHTIFLNLYETLIRYDLNLKPLPWLAESWTMAADGKSITLELRKGVKFHSGREMVADDVLKNFEKARDPDRGLSLLSQAANIENVSAPEKYKVVVRFKTVAADMLDLIDRLPIIEPEAMASIKTRASGTGPFKFVEWSPGDHWTMERFGDYWQKPFPYVDRVVVKSYRDNAAMVAALKSGIVDVLYNPAPADVKDLRRDFDILLTVPIAVFSISISTRRGPFVRKEARQAMMYAVDRKGIAETVYFGLVTPTVLPWVPESPAFDATALSRYPFDLNKARELLTTAGALNAKAELLVSSQFPDRVAVATLLKNDLAKIGFTFDIKVVDQTEWTRRLLLGDYDATVSGNANPAKYPTAIQVASIYRLINNPAWGPNLPKAYIDGMNEATSTIDPVSQKAAFDKIRNVMLDEVWNVPTDYALYTFASAKYVKGLAASSAGFPVLEGISLEK